MKAFLPNTVLAAAAVAGLFAAVPAFAAPVCLSTRDIANSNPNKDGTAIDFTMKNGKVWRNTLQGRCPDLNFEGFVWVIRGAEQVCDNQQTIRVLNSGQICSLGKFSELSKPPPKG